MTLCQSINTRQTLSGFIHPSADSHYHRRLAIPNTDLTPELAIPISSLVFSACSISKKMNGPQWTAVSHKDLLQKGQI